MNYQELIDTIEQFRAEGGDIASARDYLNTLASNLPTPHLQLNQWQRSDKPVMDDFNDDNRKIDEGFRVLSEAKADKTELTQGLAGKVDKNSLKTFKFGIYGSETAGNFTYESTGTAGYKIIDGMVFFSFGFVVSNYQSAGATGELRIKMPVGAHGAINWGQTNIMINGLEDHVYMTISGTLYKRKSNGSTSVVQVSDLKSDRCGFYGQLFYLANSAT